MTISALFDDLQVQSVDETTKMENRQYTAIDKLLGETGLRAGTIYRHITQLLAI